MSTEQLPARSNGQPITQNWFNLIRSILAGAFVPRNANGDPTAGAGSLGDSTYYWTKLFFGAVGMSMEESGGSIIFKIANTTVFTITGSGLGRSSLVPLTISTPNYIDTNTITTSSLTQFYNLYTPTQKLETQLTTTGRPVEVCLAVNPSSDGYLSVTGSQVDIYVYVYDNVSLTGGSYTRWRAPFDTFFLHGELRTILALPAGNYTISYRAEARGGGSVTGYSVGVMAYEIA